VNVIAPILTRGDEMVIQTIFYPIEMMTKRRDGKAMRIAIDGPAYDSKSFGRANYLDASAIQNGKQISVFAVNRSLEEAMDLEVRLGGGRIEKLVSGEIIGSNDPKASNTFESPNHVTPREFKDAVINSAGATLKLPPLSFVAATFEIS
jgi:alpha-N-arabinofuranosidase